MFMKVAWTVLLLGMFIMLMGFAGPAMLEMSRRSPSRLLMSAGWVSTVGLFLFGSGGFALCMRMVWKD